MKVIIDTSEFDEYMNTMDDFFSLDLMYDIGNEAVNFFKDSFRNQGWTDVRFEPWKPVNGKTKALIETGKLRNSIRINSITDSKVEIISDRLYSSIQNDGGTIKVTEKMKKYFWSQFKKTGSQKWRSMALSTKFTIPQRQFMGDSDALDKIIDELVKEEYNKKTK
jgi:phage gpG-like protein